MLIPSFPQKAVDGTKFAYGDFLRISEKKKTHVEGALETARLIANFCFLCNISYKNNILILKELIYILLQFTS